MKDNLEKYIEENRDAFDNEKAPDVMWDRLSRDLDEERSKSKTRSFKPWFYFSSGIAASFLLLVFGYVGYQYGKQSNRSDYLEGIVEYQELEERYVSEVNFKMERLNYDVLDPSISSDLKELDIIYDELKTELLVNQGANNTDIIKALKDNYETKIRILEILLRKQEGLRNKLERNETIEI